MDDCQKGGMNKYPSLQFFWADLQIHFYDRFLVVREKHELRSASLILSWRIKIIIIIVVIKMGNMIVKLDLSKKISLLSMLREASSGRQITVNFFMYLYKNLDTLLDVSKLKKKLNLHSLTKGHLKKRRLLIIKIILGEQEHLY